MANPLINRLIDELNYPSVTLDNHDAFISGTPADSNTTAVLFFTGNPTRFPESLDVAVVLPELVKAFDGKLRPGVVLEEAEADLQAKYSFRIWPALVFVRNGITLGNICKIQDWHEYIEQIDALLNSHSHLDNLIPSVNLEVEHGS